MPKFLNEDAVTALDVQPGIKRDGTSLDGDHWADGEWVRWRNKRPKKMGGFREIVNGLEGPITSVFPHSVFPHVQVHTFHTAGIQALLVDNNGVGAAPFDRTPAGFTTNDDIVWQVDKMSDSAGSGVSVIVAHPGQNRRFIDQTVNSPVYFAASSGASLFTSVGQSVSGGCVVLGEFLVIYGNDGLIKNSDANQVTDFTPGVGSFADENNPVGDKIIKGLPRRGGGRSPAGIFWSLSHLISMSFLAPTSSTAPIWAFDILSSKSTILAPNTPVEYDGVYYWPGADRFLMFNGVLRELPNPLNQDFFYDNLNFERRGLVWGTAVPRWGEIWWFFPKGSSLVPNHAVVYNVREGTWYDTPISRMAGFPPEVIRWPMWADSNSNNDSVPPGKYRLWQHEFGVDEIRGVNQLAIPSFVETSAFGFVGDGTAQDGNPADNLWTRITRYEADLRQVGNMTLEFHGGPHPRSGDVPAPNPITITPGTTHVDPREHRRLPRARWTSNTIGGDYHLGRLLFRLERGDARE